jgi:hypothetical protein
MKTQLEQMLGAAKIVWQTLMHLTQHLFRTRDSRSANPFKAMLSRVSNHQVKLLSRKPTSATQPGQLQTFAGAARKVFVDSQQIQSTREPLYLGTVRLRPSTIVIDVAGSNAFPGPIRVPVMGANLYTTHYAGLT